MSDEQKPPLRLDPGVYENIPMDAYIRDPAKEPSLNATSARVLLAQSPMHCWHASPRLNPKWQQDDSKAADFGTVVHHILLGEDDREVQVIQADNFKTKAAQEQQQLARLEGKIPILASKFEEATLVATRAREQLEGTELRGILGAGNAELTLIAEEAGIWTRCRPDWWTKDREIMLDVKTTGMSAEPNGFVRQIINMGYDLQAVIAMNGAARLTGKRPKFVFSVIEQDPPYALSLIGLSPEMEDLAERKLDYARQLWAHCLQKNQWLGYPSRICWAEPPAYHRASVEELIDLGTQA